MLQVCNIIGVDFNCRLVENWTVMPCQRSVQTRISAKPSSATAACSFRAQKIYQYEDLTICQHDANLQHRLQFRLCSYQVIHDASLAGCADFLKNLWPSTVLTPLTETRDGESCRQQRERRGISIGGSVSDYPEYGLPCSG